MDFMNRSASQPAHNNRPTNETESSSFGPVSAKVGKKPSRFSGFFKTGSVVLLILVALLVAAVVVLLGTGGSDKESKLVDTNNLQAVFLTNQQVYFGNITNINNHYITLNNIYYLTTNQQVQPTSGDSADKNANSQVSLVKLGCELHAPQDQMTINRDQVTFWENLKDSGQVATAVKQYKEQNPNGQDCSATNQQTSTGDQSQTKQ